MSSVIITQTEPFHPNQGSSFRLPGAKKTVSKFVMVIGLLGVVILFFLFPLLVVRDIVLLEQPN